MEKENKETLIKIIVSALLLAVAYVVDRFTELPMWADLLIYLVPYLVIGYEVLFEAAESIVHGELLDEDFLMCVATIGALAIGFLPNAEPQFPEAVFVMIFFQVGELFEDLAEDKSRRAISQLMDIRPDSANVERDGEILTVAPEDVQIDEIIVIKPGEKIPMDGVVIEGSSSLNTLALTGESVPRDVTVEDLVVSGCVNLTGVLRVKVVKVYSESTVAKVLDLVENAAESKSKSENFITRFARFYTPVVVVLAILIAFLPPLFSGSFAANIGEWLKRALTFLIVSCPCALVISVPLTFFAGIGNASRHGILVKGSNYLDALSKAGVVVFDKTGTLTKGVFSVTSVHPENCSEQHLLHMAAHVERFSDHPIAQSLRQAYPDEADECVVTDAREITGKGMRALVNDTEVYVGNASLMRDLGIEVAVDESKGTVVYVAIGGQYAGRIVISDVIKPDSAEAIRALRQNGVTATYMLTGDRNDVGRHVAEQLELDGYYAELLPDEKLGKLQYLKNEKTSDNSLLFVGDGINDAPVLAAADVGIAMGAIGADAAIEAADVVLMDDQPSKIATAIRIAKRTIRIARENIIFALAVKFGVLIAAAFGVAPLWLAVFADVGVMVLAVLNSTRALKSAKSESASNVKS